MQLLGQLYSVCVRVVQYGDGDRRAEDVVVGGCTTDVVERHHSVQAAPLVIDCKPSGASTVGLGVPAQGMV